MRHTLLPGPPGPLRQHWSCRTLLVLCLSTPGAAAIASSSFHHLIHIHHLSPHPLKYRSRLIPSIQTVEDINLSICFLSLSRR
ncbi:Uncharacterized protein HZ326_9967 [Fusarium oxysporum f. sp. albedinis]|nr:Uncharacterized protein HZ326_9967 [Fusarium oxysporum f. sp. albedinis]